MNFISNYFLGLKFLYSSILTIIISYIISTISIILTKLKSDSHLPKKLCQLLDWKPFKNDNKFFLFHLKSFFLSQYIQVFVTTFWSSRKNSLVRKIRLTSKFMTSQPGLQTIAINILPNISHKKGSKTIKFG